MPEALKAAHRRSQFSTREARSLAFGRSLLLAGGGYYLLDPQLHPATAAMLAEIDGERALAAPVVAHVQLTSTAASVAMRAPEQGANRPVVIASTTSHGLAALRDYVGGVNMSSSEGFLETMERSGPAARQLWWALQEEPTEMVQALPLKEADVSWFVRAMFLRRMQRTNMSGREASRDLRTAVGNRRRTEQSDGWVRTGVMTKPAVALHELFMGKPDTLDLITDEYLLTLE